MKAAASVGAPAQSSAVTRFGQFVFRYRDYLAPLGLLLILATTRPRPLLAREELDVWLDAAGLLIAALGQAIRVVVIGYAYIQRGGDKKNLAAPRLVCEGVYAHSRNPMYLGNFLLLTGLAVIYHSPIVYVLALPVYLLSILAIVKSEEEFLRGKFGDEYLDYCHRVNRFLPRLQGLRGTLGAMHFDVRRVVRKEYGTTFAWISVALALMAWEQLHWYGARAARPVLIVLSIVWSGVFVCYAIARWMKKTHRLASPD